MGWSGRKGGRRVLWLLGGLGGVHGSLGAELAEVFKNCNRDGTFFVMKARVKDGFDCARRHCRIKAALPDFTGNYMLGVALENRDVGSAR